ncbi:hypothetical protein SDC9_131454 [bioreactor metagenome]|uniref:Uncharacterized protein n=1 Tax=bioreactor metagenome TaxID=1076179 RepID=A0A645D5Z3_9ZZZZ
MGDRGFAVFGHGIVDLVLDFRDVHMQTDVVFIRKFFGFDDELVRIVENGPQAEPDLHAAVRRVVVFFKVFHLAVQFFALGFLPDAGQAFARVHDRLCEFGAQPGLGHAFRHAAHKLAARFRKAGDAGADLLQAAQKGGDVGIFFRHIALIRPDALVQPGQQVYVVPQAAAELLRRMDMGVDQPGQDNFFPRVDHFRTGPDQAFVHLADGCDSVIFDQNAAVLVDLVLFVHCYDYCVLQINLSHNAPHVFSA